MISSSVVRGEERPHDRENHEGSDHIGGDGRPSRWFYVSNETHLTPVV
jgi:hypothetical protein